MGNRQKPTKTNWFFHKQTKKKRVAHHRFSKQSPLNEFPHGHCPWNYSLGFLGLPGKMFSEEDLWGISPVDSPSKSLKRFLMNPVSLRVSTRYAVTMWCAPHTFNEWSAAQFYYCQMKGPAGVKTWLWWNEHRHVLHSSSPLIPLNLSLLRWRILRKGAALKGKAAVL